MKNIKKFSNKDWERILAGEDLLSLSTNFRKCHSYNYDYNDKYYDFLFELVKKAISGIDISKVAYLKEMMKDLISHYPVGEKFLKKYTDFLNWRQVAQYQNLSEEFIEEYKDKWQWYEICSNQILSEKFIRKHFDDFDETCWSEIAGKKENNLTESFIREFSCVLNMDFVGECQKMSKNFLREFADKICFGNWYHNDRKHETMTQEETCEFMCGYYDKNQMGLTVAEVAQGLNYDYNPY